MKSTFSGLKQRWERDDVPFAPILGCLAVFYVLLIVLFSPDQLKNDEFRYFGGANNLTRGYFVTEGNPEFTNGPGLPLLLAPVLGTLGFDFETLQIDPDTYEYRVPDAKGNPIENSLKWRLLPLRLLNAVFLTAGLFTIFRAVRHFVSNRTALIIILVIGLNPFQLRWVHVMMTESLTPLLFGGFAWAYISIFRGKQFAWRPMLLAGLLFGFLALTRTIFGYVATAALLVIPLFCLLDGRKELAWRATLPLAAALVFCLPYLAYTHHHTGRLFCWATNGGELIYWITSPHDDEFGNWQQEKWLVEDPVMAERHLDFVRHVNGLPALERNAAWMEGVRRNLQADGIEKSLARNYLANVSRAFFGAPLTRQYQTFPKLVWTLTGAAFLAAVLLALWPTLKYWQRIPEAIKLLMLIATIYFGGALLLPTGPRYWIPILPAVLIWLGFIFEKLVSIRIRIGATPADSSETRE